MDTDVTAEITAILDWMKQDMDFRRSQTGLDSDPLSPEMQTAEQVLKDMRAGKIECRRVKE